MFLDWLVLLAAVLSVVLFILGRTLPQRMAADIIRHDEVMAQPLMMLAGEVIRVFEDQISTSPELEETLSITIQDAKANLETAHKQHQIRQKYLDKRYLSARQFSKYLQEIEKARNA